VFVEGSSRIVAVPTASSVVGKAAADSLYRESVPPQSHMDASEVVAYEEAENSIL
jgi:hypothetical protein